MRNFVSNVRFQKIYFHFSSVITYLDLQWIGYIWSFTAKSIEHNKIIFLTVLTPVYFLSSLYECILRTKGLLLVIVVS